MGSEGSMIKQYYYMYKNTANTSCISRFPTKTGPRAGHLFATDISSALAPGRFLGPALAVGVGHCRWLDALFLLWPRPIRASYDRLPRA